MKKGSQGRGIEGRRGVQGTSDTLDIEPARRAPPQSMDLSSISSPSYRELYALGGRVDECKPSMRTTVQERRLVSRLTFSRFNDYITSDTVQFWHAELKSDVSYKK